MSAPGDKVGGRHQDPHPPQEGGGYPDICNDLNSVDNLPKKNFLRKINPTIKDFKSIGLSGKWLDIVALVGPEKWIELWKILDRENINQPAAMRDAQRLRVPAFSKYIKFVRNCYIEDLTRQGHDAAGIHKILGKEFPDEVLSVQSIYIYQLKMKERGNDGK